MFPIPTGLTIDYSRIATANGTNTPLADCGQGTLNVNAALFALKCYAINSGAYANKIYCLYFNDTTALTSWGAGGSSFGNTTVIASFTVRIPIVQFLGSATNGPTSVTQWASDDGTSDVLGPQGSLVPNQAFATSSTTRVFSFSVPQDLRQLVSLEINNRTFGWGPNPYPFVGGNNANSNNFYGVRGYWTSTSQFTVEFGNQGTRVSASNADNGASSWATEFTNGTRFRVGLSIGGVFIGVNLAQGNLPGFYQAGQAPGITTGATVGTGYIGETVQGQQLSSTSLFGNGTFGDMASISLTAGKWSISIVGTFILNTGTGMTAVAAGISTTSGNSATGLTEGDNYANGLPPTANANNSVFVSNYIVQPTSTTTYYLKGVGYYSGGTPQYRGRITAIRIA